MTSEGPHGGLSALSATLTGEMTKRSLLVSCRDASTPESRGRTFKLKHRMIFETPENGNRIEELWCQMNQSDFKLVLETKECKALEDFLQSCSNYLLSVG